MYTLEVYHPGEPDPVEIVKVTRAADVLEKIPVLLDQHGSCDRITVKLNATFLFAVDCRGNTIAP